MLKALPEPLERRRDATRRALELALLEIRHQPLLKFRMFAFGFSVGAAFVAGVAACPIALAALLD